MSAYDVIVLGGGHNGLTAAAYLAKAGKKVLVLEAASQVGGLARSEEFHPGFKSPGLLFDHSNVRDWVVRDLKLKDFGLQIESQRPEVLALDPTGRGRGILVGSNVEKTASEIVPYSAQDARNFYEYRAYLKKIQPLVSDLFDDIPPDVSKANLGVIWNLMNKGLQLRRLGRKDMFEFMRVAPMAIADWLNEWFETPFLKANMAFPSFAGSFNGPWSPTTHLNQILWESQAQVSVKGGGPALVEALKKACEHYGAEVRTRAEVKQILVGAKSTTGEVSQRFEGVELAQGERIHASALLSTVDPKKLVFELLPPTAVVPKFEERVKQFRNRATATVIHLAVDGKVEFANRAGEKIEFARTGEDLNQVERAFDPVKYHTLPQTPILEIAVPSVNDSGFAPEGKSVMSLLVQFTPYRLRDESKPRTVSGVQTRDWTVEDRREIYENSMKVLEKYLPGIGKRVLGQQILCPQDIEKNYGVTGGHLFHGEHAADQYFTRPCPEGARYRTPVPATYMGGSGSHPGGGLTCAPGALAARALLKGD